MLARTGYATVGRIEIHLVGVVEITQHAHTLEHMDVFAVVGDAREIVEVAGRGVAVFVFDRVGDHDGGACGGEVHARSRQVQIKFGVLGVKREIAFGLFERGIYDSPGHA